jgi:hypothetical protein
MSVDNYGNFIVGLRLERAQFAQATEVPACSHAKIPGARFCPVCGLSVHSTKQKLVMPTWWWEERLDEWDMVFGTDNEYVIVGKLLKHLDLGSRHIQGVYEVPTPPADTITLRERVTATLLNKGAPPDEIAKGTFAYWFSTLCSY